MDVDFVSKTNQLSDKELMVGFTTKQVLTRLQEEVEPSRIKKNSTLVFAHFLLDLLPMLLTSFHGMMNFFSMFVSLILRSGKPAPFSQLST